MGRAGTVLSALQLAPASLCTTAEKPALRNQLGAKGKYQHPDGAQTGRAGGQKAHGHWDGRSVSDAGCSCVFWVVMQSSAHPKAPSKLPAAPSTRWRREIAARQGPFCPP